MLGLELEGGVELALAAGGLVVIVDIGCELGLELVHGAAGLVNETADVAGHLGELAGAEEQEEENSYQNYFPWTNPETHATNILPRAAGYNGTC